jgi:hypothetical protein
MAMASTGTPARLRLVKANPSAADPSTVSLNVKELDDRDLFRGDIVALSLDSGEGADGAPRRLPFVVLSDPQIPEGSAALGEKEFRRFGPSCVEGDLVLLSSGDDMGDYAKRVELGAYEGSVVDAGWDPAALPKPKELLDGFVTPFFLESYRPVAGHDFFEMEGPGPAGPKTVKIDFSVTKLDPPGFGIIASDTEIVCTGFIAGHAGQGPLVKSAGKRA